MPDNEGIVVREHRGSFEVETETGAVLCALRSKLRKTLIYPESDNRYRSVEAVERIGVVSPVAIGDRVRIVRSEDETGVIEEVLPRRTKLSRVAPGRRVVEQVIIANADQLVTVFSVKNPTPHLRLLDRMLVAAEMGGLTPVICFNKFDLHTDDMPDINGLYAGIGYRVINTSAATGEGVDDLAETLRDRLTAIAGPSGVGKTSLLNRIRPGLGLKVKEVNLSTGKGRHTTTYLAAHKLDGRGMVIDTPGIREFSLWEIEPGDLPDWFPEMDTYTDGCKYQDCAHVHEPRCAVKEAVEDGDISRIRYESYVHLRGELAEKRKLEN